MFYNSVLLLLSLMLLASLLHIAGFSILADFPTDSGRPAAVDIHDVIMVPAASAIPDVNVFTGVPTVLLVPLLI
jgi:hypothetical protein